MCIRDSLVGAAFGFGWTPCIGPILGSILSLAAIEGNLGKSVSLLSFYSLGLAIPFIISGILIDKFLFFSKSLKKYISSITKIGGFILLLTGIAILTGQLQVLGFFILNTSIRLEISVSYIPLPTASFIFFIPSAFKI